MRVTNSMLVSNFLSDLNTNMNKLSKLQHQMSTNRKYAHVSDDPVSVIYSQQANYKLKRLTQYQNNVTRAQEWNTQVETGMKELNEIVKSAYESAISASADYKTHADHVNEAQYVRQLREQLITTLNTTLGDKYIFGGYNNTGYVDSVTGKMVPPFSASEDGGTLLFNGVPVSDIANGTMRHPYDAQTAADINGMLDGFFTGFAYPTTAAGADAEDLAAMEAVLGDISSGKYFDASSLNLTEAEGLRVQKLAQDILSSKSGVAFYDESVLDVTSSNTLGAYFNLFYGADSAGADALEDLKAAVTQVAAKGYDPASYNLDEIRQLASDTLSFDIGPGSSMDANYNGINLIMSGASNLYELVNNLYEDLMTDGIAEVSDAAMVEIDGVFTPKLPVYERVDNGDGTVTVTAKMIAKRDTDGNIVTENYLDPITGQPVLETDANGKQVYQLDKDGNYILGEDDEPLEAYVQVPVMVQETKTVKNILQAKNDGTADDIKFNIKPLQDGQNRILSAMAEIGGRTNRLTMMETRYEQDEITYTQMKSNAEDADQSEVIMRAKMAEAVYKAALATGATVIQPTLMDFLR